MKGSVSVCAVSSIAYYIGGLPYVNYGLLSINILGAGSSLYNYFTHTSHDDDHDNHHHHHCVTPHAIWY